MENQEQSDQLGQASANCRLPSQLPTYLSCCVQIGPNPALLELGSFVVPFNESHESVGFSLAISELHISDRVNASEFYPQSKSLVELCFCANR